MLSNDRYVLLSIMLSLKSMTRSVCRDVSENRISPSIFFQLFIKNIASFVSKFLYTTSLEPNNPMSGTFNYSKKSNYLFWISHRNFISILLSHEIKVSRSNQNFDPYLWQISSFKFNCMDNQTHLLHTAKSLPLLEDHLFHFYCPSVRVLIVFPWRTDVRKCSLSFQSLAISFSETSR